MTDLHFDPTRGERAATLELLHDVRRWALRMSDETASDELDTWNRRLRRHARLHARRQYVVPLDQWLEAWWLAWRGPHGGPRIVSPPPADAPITQGTAGLRLFGVSVTTELGRYVD